VFVVSAVTVAVVCYAAPPAGGRLAAASASIKESLRAGGVEVVDGAIDAAEHERQLGWVPAADLAFFGVARGQLDAGRHALERVQLAEAEAAFARAEAALQLEVSRPGVASMWGEAALGRGVALFELGRAVDAERAFRRARVLEPLLDLTEASVRPDVAKAFRRAIGARPTNAKLHVETSEGVDIWLDGALAKADVEAAPGEHLVEVRQGVVRAATLVELRDKLSVSLPLPPDPSEAALAGLRKAPSAAGAKVLTGALAAQFLAVVVGEDGRMAAVRFDAQGCATPRAVSTSGDGAALWNKLEKRGTSCDKPFDADGLFSAAVPPPIAVIVPQKPKPPKPKRVWEKPWLWVGLGAAALLGIGLGAGLAPSKTTYTLTVDGAGFAK
jgi:hypothetical protein